MKSDEWGKMYDRMQAEAREAGVCQKIVDGRRKADRARWHACGRPVEPGAGYCRMHLR